MQILGKRSKILLIVISVVMLVAIGVSFAAWDSMATVKAASGNSSTYANAKVGDIVEFGQYYQTGNKVNNIEYEKTPIRWIVVDKDERTGQLTLLSERILAAGSYFGNYYYDEKGTAPANWGAHYDSDTGVGEIPHNQAYVDSTVRAYLNNLERLDLGGDQFTSEGYLPSNIDVVDTTKGLLSSIGFSNQKYWTGQSGASNALLTKPGFSKRADNDGIYYQRPINTTAYLNRPATLGFLSEAFDDTERAMIVPKVIAGYTGHRWPDRDHDVSTKSYVEGAYDKVWIPSATELNVMNGYSWYYDPNDSATHKFDEWTNPSDEAGSTVFEYFKNKSGTELQNALKAERTDLATDGKAGNYSIPVYDKGTMNVKTAISNDTDINSSNHYWTRSPVSYWIHAARIVHDSGVFGNGYSYSSNRGVRPALILSY